MKLTRVCILVTVILMTGSMVFADVSIELRGNLGSGVGSVRTGEFDDIYGSDDQNLNIVYGFVIAPQITFGDDSSRFFIRPEAGMVFNNGVGNGFRFTYEDETIGVTGDSECTLAVSTIELPVLLGMETDFSGAWTMDYYMGPYISIPVSGTITSSTLTSGLSFSSPVLGGTAGVSGSVQAGPGNIVFDMRYLFDFASTKMTTESGDSVSVYARRNILLSAGYKINL